MENQNFEYGTNVRLRYSIIINFSARALSMFVNLIFILCVVRKLSIIEFGIWTMMIRYIGYVMPFVAIYSYWLPRTIARGINTAKTGLLLAFLLGLTSSLIYAFFIMGVSELFKQPLIPLLLAVLIVFQDYLNRGLIGISVSHSPQYVGIANLAMRIVQTILGVLLLVFYRLGLYGAVLAMVLGRTASTILLFSLNLKIIRDSELDIKFVKIWFKRSWLPLYNQLLIALLGLDVIIVRWVTSSEEPIAYFGVAIYIVGLTLATTQTLPALYARLLSRRDTRDITEAFWLVFMLSIPLSVGIIIYTEPILAIYNIRYMIIASAVRIFAIVAILRLLNVILRTTLRGLEIKDHIDLNTSLGLKETVLFKIPNTEFLVNGLYFILLGMIAYIFSYDYITIVLLWGIMRLLRLSMLILIFHHFIRKEFNISLPYRTFLKYIGKFIVASIPMILVRMLLPIPLYARIYQQVISFLPAILISGVLYFIVLYAIDPKMRDFVRRIIIYIRQQA